ncbi:MAG TPA: TolC family outer membrane protein [Steroidobacteraceae bacterium]|nr:TolC family outer membrane protein [Steroidobacteraceae bacterium]
MQGFLQVVHEAKRALLVAAVALSMHAAQANDLLDVYRQALERDAVLQGQAGLRAAQVEAGPQARAILLPQLGATAQRSRDRSSIDQSPDVYGDARSLGLTFSQTLWDLASFQQLKAANLESAAAETRFRDAQQSLLLRVSETYFRTLSAADQLATNIAERDAFGGLLNQAKVREQTGVGPRSDVVQAQSYFDATLQSVIDAENEYEDARRALQEITGDYRADLAPLREEIPLRAPEPAAVDDWVARAQQDNLTLRAGELQVEAAARRVAADQSGGMPTLALRGSLSRLRQDGLPGSDQNIDGVGLAVTWPLFQGGAVASRTRESRGLQRQAEAAYLQAQREVERRTRLAWRGALTGIERIEVAQRAVQSSRAAVESSRNKIEFGTGTEFELLNAQNLHFAAQRAYHQARFDQLTSALRLKALTGSLTERDLQQVDDLLVESLPGVAANVP